MKTTIIECAKNQSIASTESRWTCTLPEGKVIKTGDLISVEGISINSIGIGGEIIEIPQQINNNIGTLNNSLDRPLTSLFPNEKYSPSAQSLVCGMYYHHNYKDTCGMPFSNYRALPQVQGCMIDPNQASVVPNISNANYGYILGDVNNRPYEKIDLITEYPEFMGDATNTGSRFYAIGAYNYNDNGGEYLVLSQMTSPSTYNPINFIEWRMVTTELRFEVDKGYDSPENIASTINKQINMGWVSSESFQNELTNNFVLNDDGIGGQLLSSKGSIYTIPVNGNYLEATGNYFYQLPFFLYPEFVSAGYNLISPITEKAILENKDGLGFQSSQGEILNMNELPFTGVHLDFPQGTVLVSNLLFTSGNCARVRKYLWSQGGFNGGYKIDANEFLDPENETMTEAYYKEHPEIFSRFIDMGRINDSVPVAPVLGLTPLTMFTPIETAVNPNRNSEASQLKMRISYTDERWETAITPEPMTGGGVGMLLTYEILEEFVDVFTNETILAREMAKRYNINIVCVKCSSNNNQNPLPVIGFVLDAVTPLELKPRLSYSNFILYDPAFFRRSNSSIKPLGWRKKLNAEVVWPPLDPPPPTLLNTLETTLQLGAPNPTFSFDESLGRFQLSSLYWGHYIGSGTSITGTGSSPEEIIRMNSRALRFGSSANQISVPVGDRVLDSLVSILPCIPLLYADSGLGVLYFGMKINGKENKWDYIRNTYNINITKNVNSDTYSNTIVKPEKYFKNSLLYRLGWNYDDLFPTYGMARNLFLNNTYNKVPKLLLYNPVPEDAIVSIYKGIFNLGVRPLTINPYFSNSISTGLSVNNFGQPMYDIHLQRGAGCGIAPVLQPGTVIPPVPDPPAPYPEPDPVPVVIKEINLTTTSDFLTATRLPQKLEYPYWLVYSDIIGNVEYLGKNGENNNILAIANRAYTSGDFAFNFATDYTFKATKDFVLTDITTEILNPDYSSSTIADGTIVLYKIQSPIEEFEPNNQRTVRT